MKTISPSILDVNNTKYTEYVNQLIEWGVTNVHYDVMDGKFVPNTALSFDTIKSIYENTKSHTMDIHLMVENVEENINKFSAFSDIITFHFEAVNKKELENIIQNYSKDVKLGIAINPDTDINNILQYIKHFELVLVMSVFPGKGGQSFIENTLNKTKEIQQYIIENNLNTIIQMDGGINDKTIQKTFENGTNLAVVGSYLVKNFSKNTIEDLLKNA
ncbi:ribulose-phosphate 3-epimerase [Mycoplasma phocoenae]|uniref:Ribulose-phosphate 3-epimerase n=1 Tax=Mycoplasma phocoenae TaxID=754517 RepID=A0A858U7P0_9MOLU|nr:ribulose-phosphate 3-epimerase [Mycoplasma phocoenae]QJG67233.1 ribulose-phosphate 3-epimerase [Mycoplasma phocoenae]